VPRLSSALKDASLELVTLQSGIQPQPLLELPRLGIPISTEWCSARCALSLAYQLVLVEISSKEHCLIIIVAWREALSVSVRCLVLASPVTVTDRAGASL